MQLTARISEPPIKIPCGSFIRHPILKRIALEIERQAKVHMGYSRMHHRHARS